MCENEVDRVCGTGSAAISNGASETLSLRQVVSVQGKCVDNKGVLVTLSLMMVV